MNRSYKKSDSLSHNSINSQTILEVNHFDRPHDRRSISFTPSRQSNIIQSKVVVDARTSGIQLTSTTFPAVYRFSEALQKEQEHVRHEELRFSSYISDDVRSFMEAFNRVSSFILSQRTTDFLNSGRFEISNSEVMIFDQILPKFCNFEYKFDTCVIN
jgi:hypothetical protein